MSGQYSDMGFKGEKKNCAICGLTYYKPDMVLNKGKWVCLQCDDDEETE
jgi:formylmethanofuran dehydrogenase subunit E